MDEEVFADASLYNSLNTFRLDWTSSMYTMPDGVVDFTSMDVDNKLLSYTFAVNDYPTLLFHRQNNLTRGSYFSPLFDTLLIMEGKLALMSMVHDAFISYAMNEQQKPTEPAIPYIKFAQVVDNMFLNFPD